VGALHKGARDAVGDERGAGAGDEGMQQLEMGRVRGGLMYSHPDVGVKRRVARV
jgi:hypothetical protein